MVNKMSPQQIDDYIEANIIPSFMPLLNQNLKSVIWGLNGELIIATNKLSTSLGFSNYTDMRGLSIQNLLLDNGFDLFIEKFPILQKLFSVVGVTPEKVDMGIEVIRKMNNIKNRVIETKMPINAILIHPFQKINETSLLLQYIPLFHPSGQVIAVQSYLRNFKMFGIHDYLSGYEKNFLDVPKVIMDINELPLDITERQHEVIFLLTTGMTQRQTAELLNVNRGTIAKMVSETICPKFGIYDSNSQKLIDKARELNLHRYIPPNLCKPWIIVLSDDNEEETIK